MWYYYLSILLFIISVIISLSVRVLFNRYSSEYISSSLTGAEAAYKILRSQGISDVRINAISGSLTDNYDPTNKVLNLSENVYSNRSISAVAVAAHECGHAIQDNQHYALLNLRKSIVPITNISSNLSYIAILLGIIFEMSGLISFGAILFSAIVIFNLITLPVEVDASTRAMKLTRDLNIFTNEEEYRKGRKVLIAAGLTYFIALLSSILQLVRLLSMANSSRRRD